MRGDAHFSGNLTADDCESFNQFIVFAQESDYSNCHFKEIVIKKNPYIDSKQVIRLKNKSIVNGNVTFESGNGEVHLDANSQIKGEVHGGRKIYS